MNQIRSIPEKRVQVFRSLSCFQRVRTQHAEFDRLLIAIATYLIRSDLELVLLLDNHVAIHETSSLLYCIF
jgi:hypothetical protein